MELMTNTMDFVEAWGNGIDRSTWSMASSPGGGAKSAFAEIPMAWGDGTHLCCGPLAVRRSVRRKALHRTNEAIQTCRGLSGKYRERPSHFCALSAAYGSRSWANSCLAVSLIITA
jgi:hypothetical protein